MLNSGEYSLALDNEQMYFDVQLYLSKLQDIINNPDTDICVCIMDNDDFSVVGSISSEIASNCAFIIDAKFNKSQINFNKKHNIQFFSLNKTTDDEESLFSITKDNFEMVIKIECIEPEKSFKIDTSNYKIDKNSISIRFDYMSFF
jgi:hypothetical protein